MADASSQTITSRSGSMNGSGLSNTAFTTLKIAVFAPMPSASETTAMNEKPGFFVSVRNPYRRSCQSVSIDSPVSDFWFLVSGFWFLVFGFWFLVFGFWFLVSGFWFLVFGF